MKTNVNIKRIRELEFSSTSGIEKAWKQQSTKVEEKAAEKQGQGGKWQGVIGEEKMLVLKLEGSRDEGGKGDKTIAGEEKDDKSNGNGD